jgi:hypothetical protein
MRLIMPRFTDEKRVAGGARDGFVGEDEGFFVAPVVWPGAEMLCVTDGASI